MDLKRKALTGSVLVLVITALPLSIARSENTYVHAGDLNRLCTADNDINKSWCEGFISSGLEIISNAPVQGVAACVPPMTTLQEGVAVVKKWLSKHPEQDIQTASLAVAWALAEKFPCRK
jgi:Rap1a immunity proteins